MYSAFLIFSVLACSADDNSSSASEVAQKLTGSWMRTSIEENNGNGWEDITQDCDLDDVEEFSPDGVYIIYPGTDTCHGSMVEYGTWRLGAGDTKIVFTYDGYEGEYESTISTLTESYLEITHSVGDVNDTQIRKKYSKLD